MVPTLAADDFVKSTLNKERRHGVGLMLVRGLIDLGEPTFSSIRLTTETAEAAALYIQLGFQPVQDFIATHSYSSGRRPP